MPTEQNNPLEMYENIELKIKVSKAGKEIIKVIFVDPFKLMDICVNGDEGILVDCIHKGISNVKNG